jgi:hypothetical protein
MYFTKQDHLPDLTPVSIPSHTRHYPTRTNPYFSPALAPLGGWAFLVRHEVKVYISGGSAERMYDEILALHRGMKQDRVDVKLRSVSSTNRTHARGGEERLALTPAGGRCNAQRLRLDGQTGGYVYDGLVLGDSEKGLREFLAGTSAMIWRRTNPCFAWSLKKLHVELR